MNIREHKFFEGCSVKVAKQAKEAFEAMSVNMDKATKDKSLKRLNAELDVIMGNGYFFEYYLYTYIIRYALMCRRLVSVQGLAAYSYVAYLLGISTVNPVERDYPMEIMFGYHYDRLPLFIIHTSPSFKHEIIDFLCDGFGKESVYVEEFLVSLKSKGEEDESSHRMMLSIFENKIISEVEKFIFSKNVDGISLQDSMRSFNNDKLSILKPTFPSGPMKDSELVFKDRIRELMTYCISSDSYSSDADMVEKCFDAAWDGTYEGFLDIFAMIYGTGVLEADLHTADNNRLCTRDDFYKYGLNILGNEKDSWEFMDKIRKGRGNQPAFQTYLKEQDVPVNIRDGICKIGYLMSEGSLIPDAQLFLFRSSCVVI